MHWVSKESRLCWKEFEAAFIKGLKISRNLLEFKSPFDANQANYLLENNKYFDLDLIIVTDKTSSFECLFDFIKGIEDLRNLHIKRIIWSITKNSFSSYCKMCKFFMDHSELDIKAIAPKLREGKLSKLVKEIESESKSIPFYRSSKLAQTLLYVDKIYKYEGYLASFSNDFRSPIIPENLSNISINIIYVKLKSNFYQISSLNKNLLLMTLFVVHIKIIEIIDKGVKLLK